MEQYNKLYVIAEVGCNHRGELNTAKKIKVAALFCEADAVKFQKCCNRELLAEAQYNAPHSSPNNSYGNTYGEYREFLEFNLKQHKQLGYMKLRRNMQENMDSGYIMPSAAAPLKC